MAVEWDYYDKYQDIIHKYMPSVGEGDSIASQVVTAVNKLIYKWYNDGDVYDNVNSGMCGWANNISSYANWLYRYSSPQAPDILWDIVECGTEDNYEALLKNLADNLLNDKQLELWSTQDKVGSIYACDGPFEFSYYEEDEEDV